ncbi:MAG: response regulator [Proteobacteria bacterium]|nr:response regulator [Pseudomonadota bacterium]
MKQIIPIVILWMSVFGIYPLNAADEAVVKIGVLAKMGVDACMDQWQPTAEYLEGQIDGLAFEIVPLAYDRIYEAVKSGSVDFILANPSFYVELERWYGANRIATLKNRCSMGVCKTYGGVIFWQKHRTDIVGWADLRGKRFMAANAFSLGGWRIVWREFKERGIDPYRDFSELRFGLTHEDVVNAVSSGQVDAGSVRTDILEQMASEGKIRLDDFTVLGQGKSISVNASLPFLCSTRLYPEWPMAKLQSTPDDLAEKVTVALLQMKPDSPAALAASCAGWTIPLNYQPVHECLRFLKVGPYQDLGKISARDVIRSYWRWLLAVALACIGSIVVAVVIFRLNGKIRDSHERLKDEMAERRKIDEALKQAKEIAEAATRAKSEFLANMSHEIRTPMNGVIAAAELVMNEDLPPKIKRYLKIIHTSAHSLLGLINDILDFSKIEAGKMSIDNKPFMLDEVLDRVVNLFFNSASEKGIELLVDIHPETVRALVGDPMRLQQILTNLVGNSVKFTENSGFILISVKMADASDAFVTLQFQVKDTGVGIPAPYMERLFQPFTQADASDTRRYEGTGLGLSICKRLVEMMSGRIWVESAVGHGSTFYFTVKIERQPLDAVRKFDPPDEMRRLRVLVVDDCHESVLLVSRMLASFNFETETAASGAEAVEKFKKSIQCDRPIGLAIVDWRMPEMDGFETARQIKSNCRVDIPVIMMTAFGKDAEREAAEKIGICCFLTKPVYPSTLYNAIMDVFGKKGETHRLVSESIDTDATVYKKRLQGFRILVVEDNPTNSEIAVAILESAGISADTAENGRVALEKVHAQAYDAVLMDIQMPEMNGYEATKQIRKDPRMHALPIIAMTAHAMHGDEKKCIQAGMDGYISKPVRQLRLFQLLWRLLKNRRPVFSPMTSENDRHPVEKEIALPDEVDGIRIRESLVATQLEPFVYLKILKGFFTNHQNAEKEINAALAENDNERLTFLAHTLKGGAANIGAVAVMSAAGDLEKRLDNHPQASEIQALCDRLCAALNTALKSIEQLTAPETDVDGPLSGTQPYLDNVKLPVPVLERLIEALERSDPQMSREVLKELETMMDRGTFHKLEQLIENYDYEEAAALVMGMVHSDARQEKRRELR